MTVRPRDASAEETGAVDPAVAEDERPNVGRWERAVSAVAGGALVAGGLRQRSLGGAAATLVGAALVARGIGGHSRLYERLDVDTASRGRIRPGAPADAPAVERSITVGAEAAELADYWRDPESLSRIVGGFADVTTESGGYHRWRVEGPFGRTVEWQTRVVEDRTGEIFHWESLADTAVPHEGIVRFRPAPGDRGTEVALQLRYDPPGGSLGRAAMARLGFAPEALAGTALDRFKSLAETGEIPTLERNPSGRGRGDLV